jgi:hypothetical protein
MSVRSRSWSPWLSATLWGLVVLALVLVNSGNVVLAVLLGVVVTALSHRIDRAARARPEDPHSQT